MSAVVAVILLGPALGPGLVLIYDLAWAPWPATTSFALGTGAPAPRAVPSDAATLLLGWLLTPSVAQKVVLLGILILAGTGSAALLLRWRAGTGHWAVAATVIVAMWNPFVSERLLIGQWTVLLGYAVLPWALRAVLEIPGQGSASAKVGADGPPVRLGPIWHACGWMLLAGLGGANSWIVVVPAVLAVGFLARRSTAGMAWMVLCAAGAAAVWALPALAARPLGDSQGFVAFAAHADSPIGLVGSLLGGGGIWNPAAQPVERSVPLLAATFAVLLTGGVIVAATGAGARLRRPVVTAACLILGCVLVTASEGTRSLWLGLAEVPGLSLVRDSHKLVALWVVVGSVGVGLALDRVLDQHRAFRPVVILLTLIAPVAMPSMIWGAQGRLSTVSAPEDLRRAVERVSTAGNADVALLPWGQYRRYEWNAGRISLSLVPRLVRQRVVYDDSLPLASGRIAGEDPLAASVSAAIARGESPWEALASRGIRYVVLERRAGPYRVPPIPAKAATLWSSPHAAVIDLLPDQPGVRTAVGPWIWLGWGVSLTTVIGWLTVAVAKSRRFAVN